MNQLPSTFIRCLLPCLGLAALIAGCADNPSTSPVPSHGLKEFTLPLPKSTTLGANSHGGIIQFKARCVSMSPDGVTADFELQPAYGGHLGGLLGADYVKDATQRVTPVIPGGGNVISITSPKFAGIPIRSLRHVIVESSGPSTVEGINFHVSGDEFVKCTKSSSGKYLTTFRQGGSTFTMTIDELRGFADGDGKSHHNEPEWWAGEMGTIVYLRENKWIAERIPAGPDGADYSFLETKSSRGEFD